MQRLLRRVEARGRHLHGERRVCTEACVVGFCRELPLLSARTCTAHEQCESEFCNYDEERVCAKAPLSLGERCLDERRV